MWPMEVGFKRLDEDCSVDSRKIDMTLTTPWSQPKNALFAERNRHDRCSSQHVLDAVPMFSDMVPFLCVLKIHQLCIG